MLNLPRLVPQTPSAVLPRASFSRAVELPLQVPFTSQGADHLERLHFGATSDKTVDLLKRFNIALDRVSVVSGPDKKSVSLSEETKRDMVTHALEAHRLALKHKEVGNVSGDYFGSAVQLRDGTWGIGTNIETSTQDRSCGERVSMLVAWNESIHRYPEGASSQADPPTTALEGMKIKQIIMSKAQLGEHMVPCSECQGWMTSQRLFAPDTQIVTLDKVTLDKVSGEQPPVAEGEAPHYEIWIRELKDLLPLWGKQKPSLTEKPVGRLEQVFSDKASAAFKRKKAANLIDSHTISLMMRKAKKAYAQNETAGFTGQRVGVGVLLSSGHIVSEGRFEWHKRLIEPADFRAAAYGVTKVKRWRKRLLHGWQLMTGWMPGFAQRALNRGIENINNALERWCPTRLYRYIKMMVPPEPTVQAVAYFGDVPQEVPNIKSLGYFAKRNHGGPDTLVFAIEDDKIQARTIQDYLAEIYVSSTDKSSTDK